MKYALYDIASTRVMQWQDDTVFNYPSLSEGQARLELPLEFEFPTDGIWYVTNGELSQIAPPPPPPPPVTEAQAKADRDSRLNAALIKILPLQCADLLGQATQAESDSLAEWQEYCMLLGRIEAQANFPTAVDWPAIPV